MAQRGDVSGARQMLEQAELEYPHELDIKLNLAAVLRNLGDLEGALRALNSVLAIDPYHFLALLSKGALLEQTNAVRHAAVIYRDALKLAPPDDQTLPALQGSIRRAREVVTAQAEALRNHLYGQLGELLGKHADQPLARFEESLDILAGTKKVYNAQPVQLHIPRLPAIPFFNRDYFPWLPELEAATDTIREELIALLDEGMPGFSPYVHYPPGTPENQFEGLNHSQLWSSLWLWKDGVPQQEPMARCPRTTDVLASMPMADQRGFAPTAVFSALAPNTRIPPHTGSTNSRLLVHLPLVLPGKAGFRVGNEIREWRIGEAWVFDDTIEHEAWNDADKTRVILIFDIWNPLLSAAERELVSALLQEHQRWLSTPG
ncbi:MAG: aspartyl/asparaginyl beta-hydroxylase domain-containing protein [Pseudomonadota bacterium]